MTFLDVLVLAVVQGVCEMLPVSSSAHVIFAAKLMGFDPTTPAMTLLLVMLHTGTMLAVIIYFWSSWRDRYFSSASTFWPFAKMVALATVLTGIVGLALMFFIEHVVLHGGHAEIEQLFGNVYVIAGGLAAAGIIIILSSRQTATTPERSLSGAQSAWIGAVQGLCLPFRGFSRSGATISTGLLLGIDKVRAEEFSFALAVILTPPVIAKEVYRFYKAYGAQALAGNMLQVAWPSLAGMVLSFVAALLALKWLSQWLEHGKWYIFGYYCLFASVTVLVTSKMLHWA